MDRQLGLAAQVCERADVVQQRDPAGTTTPGISETATRTAASGASVSHTWTFNVAPADIDIHVQPTCGTPPSCTRMPADTAEGHARHGCLAYDGAG